MQASQICKADEKKHVFEIPKRSPCLNLCDYFLWSHVSRCMREQVNSPFRKGETRTGFLSRLRRTALSLPPDVVSAAVRRRCSRLRADDGGNIEERGRS